MGEVCIFVFFTDPKQGEWKSIKNIPKGWRFVGAGTTSPIDSKPLEYRREEQYNGPLETRDEMKRCLDKYYKSVMEKGIIEKYKIRHSFSP